MMAEPTPDSPSYEQGYAPPPISWVDRGRVFDVGVETCVPVDCYEDVLVIEEFERTKPGASQLKFYAPEVGNVRVGWRGKNEDEQEEELEKARLLPAAQRRPDGEGPGGRSRARRQRVPGGFPSTARPPPSGVS